MGWGAHYCNLDKRSAHIATFACYLCLLNSVKSEGSASILAEDAPHLLESRLHISVLMQPEERVLPGRLHDVSNVLVVRILNRFTKTHVLLYLFLLLPDEISR